MGSIAARKLAQVVDNVSHCLAIELLAAAQGIDQRAPLRPSRGVQAVHELVRSHVPTLVEDRPLYRDFAVVRELIESGKLVTAAEAAVGSLR
jgi:histidine ammonia-lyase